MELLAYLWLRFAQHNTTRFSLRFNCLTPILTAHNQGAEENPNRVMTGMLLCTGLLVESVGADRLDYLRRGALEIKQDTLGV